MNLFSNVYLFLLDVGAPLVVGHFVVAFLLDLWVLLEDVRHGSLKGAVNGKRPNGEGTTDGRQAVKGVVASCRLPPSHHRQVIAVPRLDIASLQSRQGSHA